MLKATKPELGISSSGMNQFNQIIADLYERVMTECRNMLLYNKKSTLSSKEVETAVRLLFPGELSKHGVQFGRDSLQKYAE